MEQPQASSADGASTLKRKRSSEQLEASPANTPAVKTPRASNHLAINYLARHLSEDVALVSTDDTLPSLISILAEYQGILERHESLALNLGAKPLGPIIVRRIEMFFQGPPKIIHRSASVKSDGPGVTWLDVIEFARSKPEQFTLSQMSEGAPVCQFYTKQCRVQISEEDYMLISNGIPQKMIPPQPVLGDEDKELGTIEILEQTLGSVVQLADQAKSRQLRHRIGSRKQAILDRRAADPSYTSQRSSSPSNIALMNGTSPSGFTAVNVRPPEQNGEATRLGASDDTKAELMKQFETVKQLKRTGSISTNGTVRPVATPQQGEYRPANVHTTPTPAQKDDGPYKAEILARVEGVRRGERIQPPCDRCRRLRMDCLKNLTACYGCTKKHAKCSWKDVKPHELSTPITPSAPDMDDPDIEQLRRAVHEGIPGTNESSPDHATAMAMNAAAAAGLAEVAKASTAALESTEVEMQQQHHQHPPPPPPPPQQQPPQMGQSPNLAHTSTHQSPNMGNYGTFSPQQPTAHGTSVNMAYANAGRRLSSPEGEVDSNGAAGQESMNGVEN